MDKIHLFVIFCLALTSCSQSQEFVSPGEVYSLSYPQSWTYEFSSDIENTVVFWNEKEVMGILRISAIIVGPDPENGTIGVRDSINEQHETINESILSERNDILELHWSEFAPDQEKSEDLMMYYWMLGKSDKLILVSHTVLIKNKDNPKAIADLQTAREIVNSIHISE